MLRALLLALLLALAHGAPAVAQTAPDCQGQDLLAALTPAERQALTGDAPFASGNFWRATRGTTTLTIAGTYHLNDPRFDALVPKLLPYLDASSLLLVEAGPDDEKALKDDMIAHPEHLIITTGPTLPEALSPADWQTLTQALKAQGIPAFLASKFQPWYVAVLLGMPVCHITANLQQGLDKRLMDAAEARHIPIRGLEPWDTAIRVFDGMSQADQLAMLHMTLATRGNPADLSTTLANAYFAGKHQLIWNWSRQQALAVPGGTPAERAAEFTRMEQGLLTGRTRGWIAPILADTAGKTAFIAVGAGHLGGKAGLLELLQQQGFAISRLPF